MKNRYEGLLILNVNGNEEGAKEIIERLEGEFKKAGAVVEQVQKMGTRQFSYAAGELKSGYYANFIFQLDPAALEGFQSKLKLDEDVYRQHYLRISFKKAA
ncbi:MAG: ribosomal protein [Verrucomicrobiota bacterium]